MFDGKINKSKIKEKLEEVNLDSNDINFGFSFKDFFSQIFGVEILEEKLVVVREIALQFPNPLRSLFLYHIFAPWKQVLFNMVHWHVNLCFVIEICREFVSSSQIKF
jgi:hypothetical protein